MAALRRLRSTLILATALLAAAPLAADPLDDYLKLQSGSFTTAQQARLDARYETAIWHMAEIWQPAGGAAAGGDAAAPRVRWLYSESWMKDAKAPYMQRVSRLTAEADGTLAVRRYALPEPARFVGAWQEPAKFAQLAPEALVPLEGCDLVLTRTGPQRFEGGTIGNRCRNAYKGSSYAVSQAVIAADGFTNWDRGFAADGNQTWGPKFGGYRFERLDAPPRCAEPVRMLVYGDIRERKAFGAYARALAASGLYPKHGGWYEAASPALEVFEGTPPPGRGVIIARFPCLEAARAFWNSPEYTEIRKLRDGIAQFEVLVLPGAQLPAYAAP
jgi:uncharacterized protein (DUF1330 family)